MTPQQVITELKDIDRILASGQNNTLRPMKAIRLARVEVAQLITDLQSTTPITVPDTSEAGNFTTSSSTSSVDFSEPTSLNVSHLLSDMASDISSPSTQVTETPLETIQPIKNVPEISLAYKQIISAGHCIENDNGVVGTLNLDHVALFSNSGYGLYGSPFIFAKLAHVYISSLLYYCVRGTFEVWQSWDSTFKSPLQAFRIYGTREGFSLRDLFEVKDMKLGGGTSNEWQNPERFGGEDADHPFVFSDGKIKATGQVTFYNKTQFVTFRRMDFAGTTKLFFSTPPVDPNVPFEQHIRFEQCKNIPQLHFHDASGNTFVPTTSQLETRKIFSDTPLTFRS